MSESRIIRPYPGFIIPTRRFVDAGMPKSAVGAAGRYQLIVRDAWGIEKRRTPWFDNLILDSGLNRWGTGTIITGAAIGTGTSTPTASDTGLQTQTHFTSTTGTGDGLAAGTSPNYNNTRTFVYRTALGALNGNYSEVGVGWASGSMFSRALILDGGGSPTTIAVASTEQLDIVYQLSVYPPLVDTGPTTITISGVDYDVTGRAAYVTSMSGAYSWAISTGPFAVTRNLVPYAFNGSIGAITAGPAGSSTGVDGTSNSAYVNNSLSQSGAQNFGLVYGNLVGGISAVIVGWGASATFQYGISPAIPKDATKTLALNYSVSWARRP